jgi:hypothetical protein
MTKDKGSSKTILFVIIFSLFIFYAPFGLSDAQGGNRQIPVLKVTASSDGTQSPKMWPHHPEMVVDGNIYTCWASSTKDTIGSWLKFFFKERVNVSSIAIVNGWIPRDYPNFFSQNHRAKKITAIFDDGSQEIFVLEDTNKVQRILLKTKRITRTIKIRIDAIYQAEQAEEPWVTISEISFYE